MNERFSSLSQEKQERILEAAYREFSEQGFEKASTNAIAKKAGIGKGTLFYYFNTKQDLYKFLTEYAIEYIDINYVSLIDEENGDYIERLRSAGVLKVNAYYRKSYLLKFAANFFFDKDRDEEIDKKMTQLSDIIAKKLHSNIDTSLFRKDLSAETVLTMLECSINGYEQRLTAKLDKMQIVDNLDDICNQFYVYLDNLKKIFYE